MRAINSIAVAIAATCMLSACDRKVVVEAPPRATDKAPSPTQKSLIALPINADTRALRKALERAVIELLSDHTELFKQFMANPSFKRWLADTVFAVTYEAG